MYVDVFAHLSQQEHAVYSSHMSFSWKGRRASGVLHVGIHNLSLNGRVWQRLLTQSVYYPLHSLAGNAGQHTGTHRVSTFQLTPPALLITTILAYICISMRLLQTHIILSDKRGRSSVAEIK